ncbi:subtilisin-like protein [Mycena capillaripes]|nr:subtilisin-like protein [Mycena capillaripes]
MVLTQLLIALAFIVARATAALRPVPAGWSLHRRADPDALIPLKLSLTGSNIDKLESILMDIADPRSPNYGKHWSPAQVKETFRPSQETVETLSAWLLAYGAGVHADAIELSASGDILQANMTVSAAETLLQAEFYIYSDDMDASVLRVGCHGGYTLPPHIAKHVDFVWPTIHFGGPKSLSLRDGAVYPSSSFGSERGAPTIPIENIASLAEAGCDTAVTLDCLRALYNFDFTPVSGGVNTIGVAEFGTNVYQASDLDLFFKTYRKDQVGHIPTLIIVEGGNPAIGGNVAESSLDIELMMGLLGPGQNLSLYQVGKVFKADAEPIDDLLAALDGTYCSDPAVGSESITDCGNKPRTSVISISYHFSPDLNDPSITPIVQRQCTEFGKLALTGVTFVASAGDGGVGYSQAFACAINGTLISGNPNGSFVGQLPASCPFVTAVGATSVIAGAGVQEVERSTTDFPSGGGFSNNFARPTWQTEIVQNYLDNFAPPYAASVFNRSGRAYPDVSANGWPIVIAQIGGWVHSGGTSASTPIFASIIAAVNDARIAAGKSTVGFINPALYSAAFADVYNDVTLGSNPGCGTQGFPAAPGWDPVSGLGTPNFEKLKAAFLALP